MPPYIFRYHRTPPPPSENGINYRNVEHRKRKSVYSEYYSNRKSENDNTSVNDESVYEYEQQHTARSFSSQLRKYNYDSGHYRAETNEQRRSRNNNSYHEDVREVSSRSEAPMKNVSHSEEYFMLPNGRFQRAYASEPRITLLNIRNRRDKAAHCTCHCCPQISSKNVPAMHYDELRCLHCASYAQPTQEEIMAYPWSEQNYRPHRRNLTEESFQQGRMVSTHAQVAAESTVSMPQSTRLSNTSSLVDRLSVSVADNENLLSGVSVPKRIFRSNSRTARLNVRTKRSSSQLSNPSIVSRGHTDMLTINENDGDDDVKPTDSISNISLPGLHSTSREMVRNRQFGPNILGENYNQGSYTQEKIFVDGKQPRNAMSTPRPANDSGNEISRNLNGEYYDRGNGRTYKYRIKYSPRRIDSIRIPRT